MNYTLPSDEEMAEAYAYGGPHALARKAIEHFIAEAASGVDVEALVAALPRCNRGSHDSPGSIGCPECGYENSIADAIRTAIAQAVARLSPPPSAAAPDAP